MFRSAPVRLFLFSMATIMCTVNPLSASPGIYIFQKRVTDNAQYGQSQYGQNQYSQNQYSQNQYTQGQNNPSQYPSQYPTQYNPYSQDENFNQYTDPQMYYSQPSGASAAELGGAAAVGAGLNEAKNRQDRTAAEAAALHRRETQEHAGVEQREGAQGTAGYGEQRQFGGEARGEEGRFGGEMRGSEMRGGEGRFGGEMRGGEFHEHQEGGRMGGRGMGGHGGRR